MTQSFSSGPQPARSPSTLRSRLSSGFGLVLGALAIMWVIEIVDTVVLDDWAQGGGIHPRRLDGIDGVLWAPWLHGGLGHIVSNSIPWIILGLLVMVHGRQRWLEVTIGVTLLGGALTWLLARSGNHIGASGVIFGYLGYLVAAAFVARSARAIVTGFLAIVLYGGLLWGVLPSPGISWEGHLFGGLSGAGLAFGLSSRTPSRAAPGPRRTP